MKAWSRYGLEWIFWKVEIGIETLTRVYKPEYHFQPIPDMSSIERENDIRTSYFFYRITQA